MKRSQLRTNLMRVRQEQAASARRAAQYEQQLKQQAQWLQQAGIDAAKFGANPQEYLRQKHLEFVEQQIRESQMDPAQLEFERRKAEIEQREARLKEGEDARAQQEHQARVDARANEIASDMHTVLEASNLPRDPMTVARMASLMIAAARSNAAIPKEQLAQRVAQQIETERGYHVQSLQNDPNATAQFLAPYLSPFQGDVRPLVKVLGPQLMEGLRKHILSEAQSKFAGNQQQPQQRSASPKVLEAKPTAENPNGYLTWDEMQALSRQRRL